MQFQSVTFVAAISKNVSQVFPELVSVDVTLLLFVFFSTIGDVDLDKKSGFLGYLTPSLHLLDLTYSL